MKSRRKRFFQQPVRVYVSAQLSSTGTHKQNTLLSFQFAVLMQNTARCISYFLPENRIKGLIYCEISHRTFFVTGCLLLYLGSFAMAPLLATFSYNVKRDLLTVVLEMHNTLQEVKMSLKEIAVV